MPTSKLPDLSPNCKTVSMVMLSSQMDVRLVCTVISVTGRISLPLQVYYSKALLLLSFEKGFGVLVSFVLTNF